LAQHPEYQLAIKEEIDIFFKQRRVDVVVNVMNKYCVELTDEFKENPPQEVHQFTTGPDRDIKVLFKPWKL